MSDKDRENAPKVEAQPLKPLPMPEYRYQEDYSFSGSLDHSPDSNERTEPDKVDLSGVCLNLS